MKMVLEQLKSSSLLIKSHSAPKKSKLLCVFALLILFYFGKAQIANYVTNGGFEEHYECTGTNFISKAVGWRSIDSSLYTCVQYYNPCYGNVPKSGFGGARYQWPRHDYSYGSTSFYCPPPYCSSIGNRCYFRNRLKAKLSGSTVYCVKFYVNIANYSTHGIDGFGAYFGDANLDTIKYAYIPLIYLTPQVQNPKHNIIKDTLNWVLVTGTFTATGTEKHLVIGNFLANNSTDTSFIDPALAPNVAVDVSIDDVSCIPIDLPAFAGEDKHIIPGETLYIGRQRDVGIDEDCMWYKLPVTITPTTPAIDTAAGIFVSPIVTTTYVVRQEICGVVKFDTVVVFKDGVGLHPLSGTLCGVEVYPQPASEQITLRVDNEKLYEGINLLQIFNNLGQLIREEEISFRNKKLNIDVSDLTVGIYTVKLQGVNSEVIYKRVVVNR